MDISTFGLDSFGSFDFWTTGQQANSADHKNSTVTFSNDHLKRRKLKGAEVKDSESVKAFCSIIYSSISDLSFIIGHNKAMDLVYFSACKKS